MNPLALWIFTAILTVDCIAVIALSPWLDLIDAHADTEAR